MVRKALALAAALLGAFHVWLFAGQVWNGELIDLALISRWIIAASLVGALHSLHRRGVSMVRGRQAVAVWLLAALLHGPALARDIEVVAPSIPAVVTTLAQVVTGLTIAGTVLLVLFALRNRRVAVLQQLAFGLDAPAFVGALPPRSFLRFAPRPPPIPRFSSLR